MNKKELLLTDFDLMTTKGLTQMPKALLPYLSPSEQRSLALLIRLWELMQTIQFFDEQTAIWCGNSTPFEFSQEQINYIKKYCTPENQQMIDMILNFMNVSSVMNMMNTGPMSDFMKQFSMAGKWTGAEDNKSPIMSFFSQEQSDLYQQYMNQLNQKFESENS